MTKYKGTYSASRLFDALAKIGYTPESAIQDIVDNSISANASTVQVNFLIEKETSEQGRSKPQIVHISIFDNGKGMNKAGLENALALGSSANEYTPTTLSKFGLGLKSASSSLGRKLSIISKAQDDDVYLAIVDQDAFENDEYTFTIEKLSGESKKAFLKKLSEVGAQAGTEIIIGKVKNENMPSYGSIVTELKNKTGIIYFPILRDEKVKIFINNDLIPAIDPLFRNEIDETECILNDHKWDGVSVKWNLKESYIQLSAGASSEKAILRIVQLPHPPSMNSNKILSQSNARKKYLIDAKNYGIFIYRNGRLISWADSITGLIPRDQDLYSYRGILELESSSDEVLNLDVTKSRVHFSDLALQDLSIQINETKKRSVNAWNFAKSTIREVDTNSDAVKAELAKLAIELEEEEEAEDQILPEADKERVKKAKNTLQTKTPPTEEEKKKVEEEGKPIIYVDALLNNSLWERAYDEKNGLIVKVNKSHRFIRTFEPIFRKNPEATYVFDLLIYSMVRSEYMMLKKCRTDFEAMDKVYTDFREETGNQLSEMMRELLERNSAIFDSDE